MNIAGILVDINPISIEKTGTLESYLQSADKYLDEKQKSLEINGENIQTEPKASKPEKTTVKASKTDRNISGGSKKQSVLNALRERQARLKVQEKQGQKSQAHRKGEQEL